MHRRFTTHQDALEAARGTRTVSEFTRALGVARTTYYKWLTGGFILEQYRPLIAAHSEGRITPDDFPPPWELHT